jgi:hypothetical protein
MGIRAKTIERTAQLTLVASFGCFVHSIEHLNNSGRNLWMSHHLFAVEPVMIKISREKSFDLESDALRRRRNSGAGNLTKALRE